MDSVERGEIERVAQRAALTAIACKFDARYACKFVNPRITYKGADADFSTKGNSVQSFSRKPSSALLRKAIAWTIVCSTLPFVQPSYSQAASGQKIQLTSLRGATANTCIWSLDQNRRVIVWAGDGPANGFRMGIDGKTHTFRFNEFTYDPTTGANILRSRDRKIFVRATPSGRITRRDYDLDILSIAVSLNGKNANFTGYRSCPAGD